MAYNKIFQEFSSRDHYEQSFTSTSSNTPQKLLQAQIHLKNYLSREIGNKHPLIWHNDFLPALDKLADDSLRPFDDATVDKINSHEKDQFWKELLTHVKFQLSLYGLQRLCYSALYYAYEDFFMRCYRVAA